MVVPMWSALKLQLKSIRLQMRFLAPLVLTLVAAAYLAVPLMDQVTLRWFSRDLNSRGVLVANALSDSIGAAIAEGLAARLQPLLQRTARDERLFAIALCNTRGVLVQQTERFPDGLDCAKAEEVARQAEPRFELSGGPVHVGVQTIWGPAGGALQGSPAAASAAPALAPQAASAASAAAAPRAAARPRRPLPIPRRPPRRRRR